MNHETNDPTQHVYTVADAQHEVNLYKTKMTDAYNRHRDASDKLFKAEQRLAKALREALAV